MLMHILMIPQTLHSHGYAITVGRTDWIVLTPPLSDDSPALAFLALHGRQILTGSGSSFRTRGWWKTGSDELAKYSTNLHCWIAREAKPERDKIEALGRTLCQNLSNEPPFLDTTELGCLARFSAPTKDSEWEFPSTGTMDNHKEGTIKHILSLPSLNLPWDDLEGEVRCFLSLRTAGFWEQYQALIDQNDPTTFHIPQDERQEMLDKLRFTTLQLEDSTLREKDPEEIDDTVPGLFDPTPRRVCPQR